MLAHSSERVNSDSEGDASEVETQKRKHSILTNFHKLSKEIYSTNRRDWWLESSRAYKWISEQSPVRCRGTRSHLSVDTVREKPKLHKRWRRFYESLESRHRSQKLFIWTISWKVGKYWEELSWNHRTATSHRLETRNCRTSCTSRKEGTSAVLLQPGFNEEWWSICKMSKTSWLTGNLNMNEDLGNHSKDQFFQIDALIGYLTKLRIRGWKFGRKIFWLLMNEESENLASSKYVSEGWMRQKSWKPNGMKNLYFLWQMDQQNYQEETTNSKNPLWGGNPS